jgi:ABC-type iron transport system FetAB ATPase subunit
MNGARAAKAMKEIRGCVKTYDRVKNMYDDRYDTLATLTRMTEPEKAEEKRIMTMLGGAERNVINAARELIIAIDVR